MNRFDLKIAKMADWANKGSTPSKIFNKFELKTMQKAILNCLQVSDVIANLPTGFGKSLLYQYPASLQKVNDRCIIVIVPLKALLWDAIRQARQLNIIAQQIDANIINQYYRIDKLPQMLVATPQKIFATENTLNFISSLHQNQKIRLLVIDQCHCMCEWGHDFRPAYLMLSKLKEMLTKVRLLAISATITAQVRADLNKRLCLYSGNYFQASYHRGNLYYGILNCKNKGQIAHSISQFLKQKNLTQMPGIIYCQTIAGSEQLHKQLQSLHPQLKTGLFHSKLSQKFRRQTYDDFMQGKIKVIIGTICFGMGINKKDIRYVINAGISKSPQNYYQQSGRAGRDGLQAYCMIVSYPTQTNSLNFLISNSNITAKQKSHQFLKLQQIKEYADQNIQCRRTFLFKKLGQNFNSQNCGKKCDNCLQNKEKCVVKLNFFDQASKILDSLQTSKSYFTKKQLCNFLKGKSVNVKKKGKQSQVILGQSIKGIFSKETLQIIEKIVDLMVSKKLLLKDVRKNSSKFVISYYKAAPRQATKTFNQFSVSCIKTEEKKQKQIKNIVKKQKNTNTSQRFDKYLLNRTQTNKSQSLKTQPKQQQLKVNTQILVQADIIKQNQDYQSFFFQLYGQQLNTSLDSKKQTKSQTQQLQDDDVLLQNEDGPGDIEPQPIHIDQSTEKQKQIEQDTANKLFQQYMLKKKVQTLKRLKKNRQNMEFL